MGERNKNSSFKADLKSAFKKGFRVFFAHIGSVLLNFLLPGFTTGFHYRVLMTDANNYV